MSEFMERHTVSRLVGAPPGYIGYDEGGELTEKVRRRPYSVVLLDEIEKAHPDVFNILLQILEEGQLSDNLGHTVDFRNTVVIMTSNVGAREISKDTSMGFSNLDDNEKDFSVIKDKALNALKKVFNPEFLNRVDEIIVFHSLFKEHIKEIVDIMLKEVHELLKEKQMTIEVSQEAKDYLVEHGYDKKYGARPLRRTIQKKLEDPLANELLKEKFKNGDEIVITVKDNELCFERQEGALDKDNESDSSKEEEEEAVTI
jgi:ATP-dependent Clp protease ATP-binding subunit ClpC